MKRLPFKYTSTISLCLKKVTISMYGNYARCCCLICYTTNKGYTYVTFNSITWGNVDSVCINNSINTLKEFLNFILSYKQIRIIIVYDENRGSLLCTFNTKLFKHKLLRHTILFAKLLRGSDKIIFIL